MKPKHENLRFFLKILGWLIGGPLAVTIVFGLVCKGPSGLWKEVKGTLQMMGGIYGGFAGTAAVIGILSLVYYAIAIPVKHWVAPSKTGRRPEILDLMTPNQKRWSLRGLAAAIAALGVWSAIRDPNALLAFGELYLAGVIVVASFAKRDEGKSDGAPPPLACGNWGQGETGREPGTGGETGTQC
jgi:hypothetical protein